MNHSLSLALTTGGRRLDRESGQQSYRILLSTIRFLYPILTTGGLTFSSARRIINVDNSLIALCLERFALVFNINNRRTRVQFSKTDYRYGHSLSRMVRFYIVVVKIVAA
jgi:hypothetical protein